VCRLTVVTYNIHGGRAGGLLAAVIRDLQPDVLVANEAPRAPLLWRLRCSRLARRWGLRRVAGGRDAGQNMVCVASHVQVLATSVRRLRQPLLKPMRGIVTAQCSCEGVEFGVVGVHLSLLAANRPAEARSAVADAARLRGPVMICGDLNEPPGGPAWQVFQRAGFLDVGVAGDLTFPSDRRRKRIDAVLVRGASVLSYGVPTQPVVPYVEASDHCPVRAVVELAADQRERR
jgi:endonuclease/exonuclease/phosphatase family metal-dependent hydrolase